VTALYTVTALADAHCTASQPGDLRGGALVTVNPRPTAVVTGTNAICNGSAAVVTAALTGIGPWNVTWSSNGVVVATHSGVGVSPDTLTVSPTNSNLNAAVTALYTVTALADAHCTASQPGDLRGGALVTVNPRPTAVVTGTNAICNGSAAVVTAALTGIGPWNVTWSSNGVVVATHSGVGVSPDTLTVSPTNSNPNTAVTALYTVTALADAHCSASQAGDLSGGALVTVKLPSLTIKLTNTNVILEWFGNLELQSATGLIPPPANWSNITTGAACATNQWTNPVSGSERFFRLYAPTN
jgi:ribosomal protein S8E